MGIIDTFKSLTVNKAAVRRLQNQLDVMSATRPLAGVMEQGRTYIVPMYKVHPEQIYNVAKNSDILRIVHNALRAEVFRNGYELIPADQSDSDDLVFEPAPADAVGVLSSGKAQETVRKRRFSITKAEEDGKQGLNSLEAEPAQDGRDVVPDEKGGVKTEDLAEAGVAGKGVLTPAQKAERNEIIKFLSRCNSNGQTIQEVSEELEDDLNIFDDAYMLFAFSYSDQGMPEKLLEVLRVDPKYMGLVMNDQDMCGRDNKGNFIMTSVSDRTNRHVVPFDQAENAVNPANGEKMYPIWYSHRGMNGSETFYFEHEIVHANRYMPSKRYGYSPVITLWEKVQTLLAMDQYVQQLYQGQRPPKGILMARTGNSEALSTAWEKMKSKVKENPHLPGLLGIQGGATGDSGRFAEYFDFMKGFDEMQYTEARQEMRNIIGAFYMVSPIFQNDTSTSGGLNNEGLQITVTNRGSARCQGTHNTKFYRRLMQCLGKAHWVLQLRPSEEQDEMAKLERLEKSIKVGSDAVTAGLVAIFDEDKGETVIKGGSFVKAEPVDPFGGTTGGAGGFPPGKPGEPKPPGNAGKEGTPPKPDAGGKPETNKDTSVSKASPRPFQKELQETINAFMKEKGRNPTAEELEDVKQLIKAQLTSRLRKTAADMFKKTYLQVVDEVETDLGMNLLFGQRDENALLYLETNAILNQSFVGLTNDVAAQLGVAVRDAYANPAGVSVDDLAEKLAEVAEFAEGRAANIARTEIGKVSAAARKISYEKASEERNEVFLFRHAGPTDARTTPACKRIMQRTANGVPWNEYVDIIEEESKQEFPDWSVDKQAPLAHYQCRHVPLRVTNRL